MADDDLADVIAPGTVLAGKYEVVRLLGKGGMGVVVEARHLKLGQNVALKVLRSTLRADAEVTTRFEREARAAGRLQGPHVVRIFDVDALPDGSPFMVMELLRGRELGELLEERGPLPIRDAVGYILQACAGMSEAHRAGIVHRDIKPSNLFISEADGRVKLLDFGISKLAGDVQASVTTTASAFGTPLYMSPEQVRSAKHVDARTDVWALGVVLYELIAGVPPFVRDSATAILAAIIMDKPVRLDERRKDVPAGLAKAVMKALEKDPRARYSDVRDFAAALAPYGPPRDDPSLTGIAAEMAMPRSAGGPVLAETAFGDMAAPPPRSRKLFVAAAAVAFALFLVAAFFATRTHAPAPTAALDEGKSAQTAPATAPAPSSASTSIATEPTAPEPTAKPAAPPRPTATPPTPASSASARPKTTATATLAPSSAPTAPPPDPKYL